MKLHYQTVSPVLLDCLHRLMSHPAFKDFYLVGGTSLALQRGHRLSIDIDLFTGVPYGEMKTSVLDGVMWYLKFCIGYFILILLYFIYRIQCK